ncbi:MAG: xanthine dehydrogenase [Chloroflexi bacterium HGW-Chloroflexi-4]|jgi:putative selenate reductase molybdopterin-binding subunit|nr:MAG: xanthine dehydrogenase [Chloroflexi bacterium HGW-Chloroflexi-4]
MSDSKSELKVTINQEAKTLMVGQDESLLDALRAASYFSVKSGCDTKSCGVCTVLVNGKPIKSCHTRALDVKGTEILTVEGLSKDGELHPIQSAFLETGAIQCGFCTPAQILTVKAFLDRNPDPNEDEIRKAINNVICRCTGYVRGVAAVKRAAAYLRGETPEPYVHIEGLLPKDAAQTELPQAFYRREEEHLPLPPLVLTPAEMPLKAVVGQGEAKVDGKKLAEGKPVFTGDIHMEGMLYGALLTSPHANANIRNIDASKARALPGVHAVLTYKDIPRIKYATGGQSYPQPLPYDQVSLDNVVRHVGDRVAVVAAETIELAEHALSLIEVDYEVLPAIIDPEEALKPGAPMVHAETDTEGIFDAKRNVVCHIEADYGNIEKGFKEADHIFEGEYHTPKQQHVHLEPHVCISYLDEDDRLVLRTSTQVPFHVRRMVAPLIGLPVKKIRVIKPRIGGGFGNKQEMILEDLCAHLTLKTKRPVQMEYTRTQEFISSRSRHAMVIRYKIGIKGDRVSTAELNLIGDTGAYGCHALTVNMVGGFKGLTLYNPDNIRFNCDVVYTNTPPAGAFRGYGAMQCEYAIEVLMEEIADKLGLDVIEFKRKNWIKVGDAMNLSKKLGEGREGVEQTLTTSRIAECVDIGAKATDYRAKREKYQNQSGPIRKGIGFAISMHGSGIADLDMASATLKMNDDGSFNLLIGATDLGTGSDTILGQIAAEELGIPLDDIIVYSSDTDFTPFDKGAYASSTTYISGYAVLKAARLIKEQLQEQAALMLELPKGTQFTINDRKVTSADGRSVSFNDIGLSSLHMQNQHQIMATASHTSPMSPPPTSAQFAEIEVNTETGEIKVERLLMLVDCGRVINPITAAGQVEGGMSQGLGFALTEEMLFDEQGKPLNPSLVKYHVPKAAEMPIMDVIFVQTDEPSGPYGAKSVSEIAIDGVAPAMANALHNATGVWIRELPLTPERVLKGLKK